MPRVDVQIVRAWRYRNAPKDIQYIIVDEGVEKHQSVEEGSPLYKVLDQLLAKKGYYGPKSASA